MTCLNSNSDSSCLKSLNKTTHQNATSQCDITTQHNNEMLQHHATAHRHIIMRHYNERRPTKFQHFFQPTTQTIQIKQSEITNLFEERKWNMVSRKCKQFHHLLVGLFWLCILQRVPQTVLCLKMSMS